MIEALILTIGAIAFLFKRFLFNLLRRFIEKKGLAAS